MVSASEDKTLGQIIESHALRELTGEIMNEIVQIACRQGVDLPETIVAQSLDKAGNFPYETKTSFQRDFEQMDRPDERNLYGDTIIRLGKQTGVQTPYTCLIQNRLELAKKITV